MAKELDALLARFAEHRSLNGLNSDIGGRYSILIDNDLEVALFQSGDRLYIEAALESLPADTYKVEQLLRHYLQLQLVRSPNKLETVSLEPDSDRLILFRQLSIKALSLDAFEQVLEEFANSLDFWILNNTTSATHLPAPASMQILFP